jgi:hypothetical protein
LGEEKAEKEVIKKGGGIGIGNRMIAQIIKRAENRIDDEKNNRDAKEKLQPCDGHAIMVKVGPKGAFKPVGMDFTCAKLDNPPFRDAPFPVHAASLTESPRNLNFYDENSAKNFPFIFIPRRYSARG